VTILRTVSTFAISFLYSWTTFAYSTFRYGPTSGVTKEGTGCPGPQSFRQNISMRINCTKFANLVSLFSEKIFKIVATRAHLLKLNCIKFDFSWGSARPRSGELITLPRPPSWIIGGPTSKGRKGGEKRRAWEKREKVKGGGRKGKGQNGKGREGEGRRGLQIEISSYATGPN